MARTKDEEKHSLIHKATLNLVLRQGFSSLKMADVAREAGLATGTVYVYYTSREALINAVYRSVKHRILDVLLDPIWERPLPGQTFRLRWEAYFGYCFRHPEEMEFVEQFFFSGVIASEILTEVEARMTLLDEFLVRCMEMGVIRNLEVGLLKAHMQGSVHELVRYLHRQGRTWESLDLDALFDLTWFSLRR